MASFLRPALTRRTFPLSWRRRLASHRPGRSGAETRHGRGSPRFPAALSGVLADRGISCSNPRRFTEKVTEHASHEGLHRLIAMLMSRIRDEGVCFVFHNESPDELPRLAASLPGELADTFGFTGWQATTILRQIQPARPGQD